MNWTRHLEFASRRSLTGFGLRAMSGKEGRACDAVLRVLESRSGETRSGLRRPEKDGIGPPVDLRVRLGPHEHAFEHSLIEPFEGAVRTGILFSQLLEPVHREVADWLPGPAWYALHLPLDPSLGVPGRELRSSQRALSEWILSEAGPLYRRSLAILERDSFPRSFQASVEADLPGFPYPVKMSCDARRLRGRRKEGQLLAARIGPDDDELEPKRTKRVRRTLSDKCPKLKQCRDDGARTVLVLESHDIALSSRILVRDALVGPLSERPDARTRSTWSRRIAGGRRSAACPWGRRQS